MAGIKQSQSILFRAPFDVRRIIFSYLCPSAVHVHTKDDKVLVTTCVSPEAIHDQSDGEDRKADLPPAGRSWNCEDDYLYAQRLMSTWGPHWRCEEAARKGHCDLAHSTLLSMLRVCKLMRDEVSDLMIRDAVFNITGLGPSWQLLACHTSLQVLRCTFEDIRKLDITLRLSMDVFRAVNQDADKACVDTPSLHVGSTEASAWMDVCGILAQLPKLTILRLWLDHDECRYWADVDERAFVGPLVASFAQKEVEVILHLPFVNPRFEDAERHFEEDKVAPHVKIVRRSRQREFGRVTLKCRLGVSDYLDFPCLDDRLQVFEDMDPDEISAKERSLWKHGENIQFWKDGFMHVNRAGHLLVEEDVWEQRAVKREEELGISLRWPTVL